MADTYALKNKLELLEPWQYQITLNNTGAVQLTEDCSNKCPDCGLGANKGRKDGPGDAMPFDYLEELVAKLQYWQRGIITPWFKDDIMEYGSQGKGPRDVHELFGETFLKTGVPPGTEEKVLSCLDIISNITIRRDRRDKMGEFIKRLEHKIDKNSSYHVKICDDSDWMRLGPQYDEKELSDTGIVNFHGVLLTPTEIYSIRTVRPSKEHPYGYIQTPVTPDNFKVAALCIGPKNWVAEPEYLNETMYNGFLDEDYHEIDSKVNQLEPPFDYLLADGYEIMRRCVECRHILQGRKIPRGDLRIDPISFSHHLKEIREEIQENTSKAELDSNEIKRNLLDNLEEWIKLIESDLQHSLV